MELVLVRFSSRSRFNRHSPPRARPPLGSPSKFLFDKSDTWRSDFFLTGSCHGDLPNHQKRPLAVCPSTSHRLRIAARINQSFGVALLDMAASFRSARPKSLA